MSTYVLRARLAPMALLILPALLVIAVLSVPLDGWNSVWPVVGVAVLMLGAEVARDAGKRRQVELIRTWGGWPTTLALRYRGPTNRATVERRHAAMAAFLGPDFNLPSAEEEEGDPDSADDAYEVAVDAVRARVASSSCPRLLAENASYGFRRNAYGLRIPGMVLAATSMVAASIALSVAEEGGGQPVGRFAVPILTAGIALLFWWRIDGDWVRRAADSYVMCLFQCVETQLAKPG